MYFTEKIKKELACTENECVTIAVQSDTHHSSNDYRKNGKDFPPTNLKDIISFQEISKEIRLDAVCNLGDMVRGYEFDPVDYTRKDLKEAVELYVKNASYPVFLISGNHDNGVLWTVNEAFGSGNCSFDELLMPAERYEIMIKPLKKTADICDNQGKMYYYCDINGIRIIALDTDDLDYKKLDKSDVNINNHKISREQISWFRDVALDTELPVIILCHVPLLEELLKGSGGATGSEEILNMIDGFRVNGGQVVAVLSGHMHFKDAALHKGVNHIVFGLGYEAAEIMTVFKKTRKIKLTELTDGTEREYEF